MKNSYKLLYILVLFLVFYNFKAWMFVGGSVSWSFYVAPLLILLSLSNTKLFSFTNEKIIFIVLSFVVFGYERGLHDFGGVIGAVFDMTALYVIVLLNEKNRCKLLDWFDKIMLPITAVSVVWWILYLLHVPLPHHDFDWIISEESYYHFENYYLFLFCVQDAVINIFPRFSSIFYEPGYSAIILVFLLLYHKFDFHKRAVQIYSVALFFTFSLSGFVMFFLMWGGFSLCKSAKGIPYILCLIVLLYGGQVFFKDYNNGDNPVNELILARLEIEDGNIAGYNRTGKTFDDDFEDFIKRGDSHVCFGAPKGMVKSMNLANVGWKVYFYVNGLVCFVFFLLCVWLVFSPYKKKVFCALPMILYLLTFARGHRVMWFSGYWLLWVGIMSFFNSDNLKKIEFKKSSK